MRIRHFWLNYLERLWKEKSIIWISGVRRSGKTSLCKTIKDAQYFDCELPRVRASMVNPEEFLEGLKSKRIVLDEIHRLSNPSELLKIAADHFPHIQIAATGSSMLGASSKFKDTLTGRKRELWLTPMVSEDLVDFHSLDLKHRFLRGGLPPFLLSEDYPHQGFQEWVDSYWAKDVLELFRLERRHSFMKFFELLMVQSAGIFEASTFAGPCEVSRTTISNYLSVLEATYVVSVVRPYSTHQASEIISAPKVYAFDTGFMCYYRGWEQLRKDDLGVLWEHYVLNEIQGHLQTRDICYWRDKQGREIDFVIKPRGKEPIAIECKWGAKDVSVRNIHAFKSLYPEAKVICISHDVKETYIARLGEHKVTYCNLAEGMKMIGIG